jgi:aspartyl protease family protein
MMRGYLILVVALGLFASLAGRFGATSPQPVSGDRKAHIVAEPSTRTEAPADTSGGNVQAADGSVRLEREPDGHFYADVQINGATVNALVDTGASGIALSRADARKAGVATSIGMPNVIGQGADGEVYGEIVTLDSISLGSQSAEGMRAMVLNAGEQTLLGQDFLSKFENVEIRGDTMVLR